MPDNFPIEQRRYYRHPLSVPIRFSERKNQARGHSASVDLSEGGICFHSERFLAKGTDVCVSIPVDQSIFDVEGKVTYCNRVPRLSSYRTGVAFRDASSAFRARLVEQMIKIKEYRNERSEELGYELPEEEAAREWIEKYAKHFSQLF